MTREASAGGGVSFKWSPAEAAKSYQAPEAFLCVLSLAAGADRSMDVGESDWLQQQTRRWWRRGVLAERDVAALNAAVCTRLADGQAALGPACAALPRPCRPALYAQALDLMLGDGPLRPAEEEFAAKLESALELEPEAAAQIRACMVLKNAF